MLLCGPVFAGDGIRLKTRTLGAEALRDSLGEPLKRLRDGTSHYLVRFSSPPPADTLSKLSGFGIRATARVSGEVLLMSGPDGLRGWLNGRAEIGRLTAVDKLSPALVEDAFTGWLVEFHADVAAADRLEIVHRTGLETLSHPDLLPHQLLVVGDAARVESLAEWDEVAYIFPASLDLVLGNRVAGCAGALIEDAVAGQYVKMGNGWGASSSAGSEIRYFFQSLTGKIARSTTEAEIVRALQEWARYARIDFSAGGSATAARSITVQFGRKSHGDPYPFDGPGKVLAHTFYPSPPNSEPIAGDMHFDDDEEWKTGSAVDVFTVALHEAGHALGLAHSDKPTSVMYPYYRQATGLTSDDIAGIQALYGSRGASQPDTPTKPAQPAFTLTVSAPPATTTETAIGLSGTVQNATGQPRVTWYNNRGGSGLATGAAAWSIAAVPLSLGANVITLNALDEGSHSASRALTITRQSAGGTPPASSAPPSLRITSPAFTIVSTSLATITLRGTAGASAERIAWSTSTGQSGEATGTASWSATVPLYQGTNTVTVRAFDGSGNSSWRALTVVRR